MSKNPIKDEKEILQELAGGSESAFAWIFNHFSPRVYSTSLWFLRSEESAREVVYSDKPREGFRHDLH